MKKAERLINNLTERLRWIGAKQDGDYYKIATCHGTLSIRPCANTIKRYGATVDLFCEFENHIAAHRHVKNVGMTGKWNWFCLDQTGVDFFLKHLKELELPL